MDFAQVSLFIMRVRWRVKVNLHSLGVCQLFVLSANTIFSMCCIRESVYHRNKKLLQVFNLKTEGSLVYMVKIRVELMLITFVPDWKTFLFNLFRLASFVSKKATQL